MRFARMAWSLGAALAAGSLAPGGALAQSCIAGVRTLENASAARVDYEFGAAGHGVKASGVTWTGVFDHAINLEGSQAACFHGGYVHGPYPEDVVYECTSEHCPGGVCPNPCLDYHTTAGISAEVAAPTVVEDVRISDYGDGISQEQDANRADLEIRRVYLHDIHDDAVENDWGASVRVIDSLFERVNIAFASRQRSGESIDARGKVFEVRNTLVQLHRFTNTYKNKPGSGGFWKWGHEGLDPRFAVTDNRFLADTADGLLFPLVNQVVECSNNTLLWAGTIAAFEDELDDEDDSDGLDNRGRMQALRNCFTVIVKPADVTKAAFLAQHWDPFVKAWKATHLAAGGAQTSATPTPAPTRTPTPTATPSATAPPTRSATPAPTRTPAPAPSALPSAAPSRTATPAPTGSATPAPTRSAPPAPTSSTPPAPTGSGTPLPTPVPSPAPTASPSPNPSEPPQEPILLP
jgi:hypothetical protein